ncbi:phosphoglucosamine mutase [Methanothermococcus okinawensis]|uniref:Phosphoglucosamine mutase n=1 Tax=Methanothermococcus okinawensis (strain DSM 14208 / JCM 11175 / IH1) TaxID=647113 RepID=F8AMJ3_METOI|nr:phosphoglucosamine mutase [Methanothermococcus okinawensis]AEH06033.1 Phosphoglucosamine mutase [Methanothermococcus okinawensis IH1]
MRLFGTSGIRMKNLNPEIAYKIGFAVSQIAKNVVIGRDTRTTGGLIKNALITGLLNGGADITNIGIVPTPTLGFSARDYDIGIMITASHNPPEYNGIKLFNRDGTAFRPEQEKQIEKIVFNKDFKRADWNCIGNVWKDETAIKRYRDFILKHIDIDKHYNVVVDCANSAGCVVSPYLFTDVGAHVISVNAHIDGRFVGRMPEPNEKNLYETMKMIRGLNERDKTDNGSNSNGNNINKKYIGIAHDGDADRMIAIDEKGRLTDFDKLLAIFSRYIVEKTNKKTIITTVDASMSIDVYLKDLNVNIIRTKVGDVAVSEALNKYNAIFGGEPSGTWIHRDIHLTPDGILSGLRILEMMEFYDKKLYELIDEVPSYVNLREKFPCPDNKKLDIMNYVIEHGEKIYRVIPETIDGARFNLDDGWVLIRPSGTEPYIRIRVEAKNPNMAKELLEKGIKLVKMAK